MQRSPGERGSERARSEENLLLLCHSSDQSDGVLFSPPSSFQPCLVLQVLKLWRLQQNATPANRTNGFVTASFNVSDLCMNVWVYPLLSCRPTVHWAFVFRYRSLNQYLLDFNYKLSFLLFEETYFRVSQALSPNLFFYFVYCGCF